MEITDEMIDDDGYEMVDMESEAVVLRSVAGYTTRRTAIQIDHMCVKPKKYTILSDDDFQDSTDTNGFLEQDESPCNQIPITLDKWFRRCPKK